MGKVKETVSESLSKITELGYSLAGIETSFFYHCIKIKIAKTSEKTSIPSENQLKEAFSKITAETNFSFVSFLFLKTSLTANEKKMLMGVVARSVPNSIGSFIDDGKNARKMFFTSKETFDEFGDEYFSEINEQSNEFSIKFNVESTFSNAEDVKGMKEIDMWTLDQKQENGKFTRKKGASFTKVKISEIPSSKIGLDSFFNDLIEVTGTIFQSENRKTGSCFLFRFLIFDGTDSIEVKKFVQQNSFDKYAAIACGDMITVRGAPQFDEYSHEVVIMAESILDKGRFVREDDTPNFQKTTRTELHVHTQYSAMDGLISPDELFSTAESLGIKAVAVTDHEGVQAFPEIEKVSKKGKIKPIYGVEFNVRNDSERGISFRNDFPFSDDVVGVDIETTGLSFVYDEIIEISACRKKQDGTFDDFDTFVKIDNIDALTSEISSLTSITKENVLGGMDKKLALEGFLNFVGKSTIVAHNAKFDTGFLKRKIKDVLGKDINFTYIDTLNLSRAVLKDDLKRFGLDSVCKKLKIELTEHHRAIYDARACYDIFFSLMKKLNEKEVDVASVLDADFPIVMDIQARGKKNEETIIEAAKATGSDFEVMAKKTDKSFGIISVALKNKDSMASLLKMIGKAKVKEVKKILSGRSFESLNDLKDVNPSSKNVMHVTALVKNQAGLKSLYKLVSLSNTEYLADGVPTITWDELKKNGKDLLFGTSCVFGLFEKMFDEGEEAFEKYFKAGRYDYIEIQPVDCYASITVSPFFKDEIIDCVKKIIRFADKNGVTIVADSDAHYMKKSDKKYRDILIGSKGIGGIVHPLKGKRTGFQHLLSANEMIEEMKEYVPDDRVNEIVVKNPDSILAMISDVRIVNDGLCVPTDDFMKDKGIPSVKSEFEKIISENIERYRDKSTGLIPQYVLDRCNREKKSIVDNGYAVIYYIAYLLVKKSNADGYVVGSRGSVGSSFAATLLGITEVNPLAPHYLCPKCGYSEFKGEQGGLFKSELDSVSDGFDLPDEICPHCGEKMERNGHDIPFETFLGFEADKVPDIDLNFSGVYQWKAHNFCKEIFGSDHAFRAGTISTIADKTAFGMTKAYLDERGETKRNAEIERMALHLEGTKRTTGQHPGGIIVIPANYSVLDFTPFQYPANKKDSDWYTTHFDFHAIHDSVLKLDILGHDDPTVLKFLMDRVAKNPDKYPFRTLKEIPLNDKNVYKYLQPDQYGNVQAYGLPEFGTDFVREMLSDTFPKTFSDLVKVSGLSHGTDVWNNNAQDLINGKLGTPVPFSDVIGCRDDIMTWLSSKGMTSKQSFDIMEFVRHGYGFKKPKEWPQYDKMMKDAKIPDWFRWSCERIQYLFPKAHATAYVMSALRIAWFKAYDPIGFYASYFTIRAASINIETIVSGPTAIKLKIAEIKSNKEATDIEKDSIPVLEVALECFSRGISIAKPDPNLSEANEFVTDDTNATLVASFSSIDGLGEAAACKIVESRKQSPFTSLSDFAARSGANKTIIKKMVDMGCFAALPVNDIISEGQK